MLESIQKIVDSRLGIIKMVHELPSYPLNMYTKVAYRQALATPDNTTIIGSIVGGLGYSLTSSHHAEIKALGEALERYSSAFVGYDKVTTGSYNSLSPFNRLDPLTVTGYEDWQYEMKDFIFKKIDHNTEFIWAKGIDNFNHTEIWIPTCLVLLNGSYRNVIRDVISTGLAAGSTFQQAFEGGVLECIERDAIMIMWLNELSMPIIDHDSINDLVIQKAIKNCEKLNLDLVILDITTDILVPTYFVLILNKDSFPYAIVAANSHYDYTKALRGAIEEAFACFNTLYHKNSNGSISEKDFSDLSKLSIHDHSDYYAKGLGLQNLEFLLKGKKISLEESSKNKITSFEGLMKRLKEMNLNVLSVDITTEDVRHLDLSVCRVVMPELAFLESTYPMLKCRRLRTSPVAMGYKTKETFNINPHPFP